MWRIDTTDNIINIGNYYIIVTAIGIQRFFVSKILCLHIFNPFHTGAWTLDQFIFDLSRDSLGLVAAILRHYDL